MSEQRERILSHACDLYLSDGLEGFSMRKLARAVGVTAPALYRHYESKERLLQDVMVQAYQHFSQYLYRALVGTTPRERMHLASQGYLDFALEHPKLYDILFATPDTSGLGESSEELEALGCAVGQFWRDRVRECMDDGILAEGDTESISTTMWAHAHGLLTLHRKGVLTRGGELSDEEFRSVFEASSIRLLSGLGTAEFVADLASEGGMGTDDSAQTGGEAVPGAATVSVRE
ncbi:MAG: TetR/AcrR family transcriptional regulator [Gemmatimonadota bacterium]